VTELVAGPYADERVLRPKDRKHAVAHRSGAAVMADLEHVDVAKNPLVDEWLQHITLRVAGQHSRESRHRCEQDDTRRVVGRIIDGRRWGLDGKLDAPCCKHVTRSDLTNASSPAEVLGAGQDL
jgi:hypothetical protein